MVTAVAFIMSARVGLESIDTLMYAAVDLLLGYCFLVSVIAIFVVPDASQRRHMRTHAHVHGTMHVHVDVQA